MEKQLNQQAYNDLFNKIEMLRNEFASKKEFNILEAFHLNENQHSNIIVKLLSYESEDNNKKLLELFLKSESVQIENFEIGNAKIVRELEGIDIAICNDHQMIIIENKIHDAVDQPGQLFRYFNDSQKKFKPENIYIIYLTKYGHKYSDYSFPSDKKEVLKNAIKCISFEKDIIKWLEEYKNSLNEKTSLFYSIEMYIDFIRKTINRDKYLDEIIKFLIEKPEQMELAIDLVKSLQGRNFFEIQAIRKKVERQIYNELQNWTDIDDWYDSDESGIREIDDDEHCISFFFERDCIYAKQDNNDKEYGVVYGHNIADKNLLYLITGNEEGIKEWIKMIYESC